MQYCANHPEEISKLSKLKAQITEVKGIMMDNIEKVYSSLPDDPYLYLYALYSYLCYCKFFWHYRYVDVGFNIWLLFSDLL